MIPSPVGAACAYYFELKGQDVLKDVGTRCRGVDGGKCGEEILALRGRLVEEPEACQGGETDIPELQQGLLKLSFDESRRDAVLTFRITSTSDGDERTIRSRAILAKARQLFDICVQHETTSGTYYNRILLPHKVNRLQELTTSV